MSVKTFKNTVATKSAHVTTVHFCQGEKAPAHFGVWEECTAEDLQNAKYNEPLYRQAGVQYFGRI